MATVSQANPVPRVVIRQPRDENPTLPHHLIEEALCNALTLCNTEMVERILTYQGTTRAEWVVSNAFRDSIDCERTFHFLLSVNQSYPQHTFTLHDRAIQRIMLYAWSNNLYPLFKALAEKLPQESLSRTTYKALLAHVQTIKCSLDFIPPFDRVKERLSKEHKEALIGGIIHVSIARGILCGGILQYLWEQQDPDICSAIALQNVWKEGQSLAAQGRYYELSRVAQMPFKDRWPLEQLAPIFHVLISRRPRSWDSQIAYRELCALPQLQTVDRAWQSLLQSAASACMISTPPDSGSSCCTIS